MRTEDVSPRYRDLDAWPAIDGLTAMFEGQLAAVAAVRPALPQLEAAVEAAVRPLSGDEGRLIYVGAGTSGRLGVLDSSELYPTFSWPRERALFAMAGGRDAIFASVENAEDDEDAARRWMAEHAVGRDDVVIGIAASGGTPYTVAGVKEARERGAVTIGIANNAGAPLLSAARFPVLIDTGAEIVAGSTRMKAGTAQKIALNLFSTELMVRLGRVHGGLMVQMRVTNAKLRRRGADMVARISGCPRDEAVRALEAADGELKLACVIAKGVSAQEAAAILARNGGHLRAALLEAESGALPDLDDGS
ncbi:N-acetylmuramic acid 6-phosphate etherase [Terrarubrum flagellatum]|uniref:N-acetylmuramic acid 6-phosphate etherase n=1 Tax=Terrirubrum flagellatum TaxID=2895980 RepID=UPI00314540C5